MTAELRTRDGRLNALAKINSAKRYLEVGVAGGLTFTRVEVDFRVAVDPKFNFDTSAHEDDKTKFHEVISDEFFTRHADAHGVLIWYTSMGYTRSSKRYGISVHP